MIFRSHVTLDPLQFFFVCVRRLIKVLSGQDLLFSLCGLKQSRVEAFSNTESFTEPLFLSLFLTCLIYCFWFTSDPEAGRLFWTRGGEDERGDGGGHLDRMVREKIGGYFRWNIYVIQIVKAFHCHCLEKSSRDILPNILFCGRNKFIK